MVSASALPGEVGPGVQRGQRTVQASAVGLIGSDRHVDIAGGAGEAMQLQRDAAHEHEPHLMVGEHAE